MSECLSVRNTESEDKYFLHSSLLIRLQLAIQKSIDRGHILLISYLPREAVTHCKISGLNEISHVSCLMHDMYFFFFPSFFCEYKRISINVSARNRPQQYKKNSNWGWRGVGGVYSSGNYSTGSFSTCHSTFSLTKSSALLQ